MITPPAGVHGPGHGLKRGTDGILSWRRSQSTKIGLRCIRRYGTGAFPELRGASAPTECPVHSGTVMDGTGGRHRGSRDSRDG